MVAFGPDFGVFWANIWCNIFAFLVQKTAGKVVGSACWLPGSTTLATGGLLVRSCSEASFCLYNSTKKAS